MCIRGGYIFAGLTYTVDWVRDGWGIGAGVREWLRVVMVTGWGMSDLVGVAVVSVIFRGWVSGYAGSGGIFWSAGVGNGSSGRFWRRVWRPVGILSRLRIRPFFFLARRIRFSSLIAYGEKPVRKIVNFIAKTLMCYRSRMYTGRRRTDRAGLGVYDCVVCGGEVFTIPQDQYFNVIEPSWICTDCGVLYVDPDGQTSMRKQNASSFAPQAWVQDTAIHVRRA